MCSVLRVEPAGGPIVSKPVLRGETHVTEDLFLDPWPEFSEICRKTEELMDSFLRQLAEPAGPQVAFVPQCDVSRTPREYTLRLALPGVLEEDIDLNFAGPLLTIRGEREDPFSPGGGEILNRELRDGYFERSFALPFPLDPAKVRVQFSEGILFVRIERPEA
jgi:HSP20 family protein